MLKQPRAVDVVVGGNEIADFMSAVDTLDLVVASDGGTAHLCSLVTPIVSVFGPQSFPSIRAVRSSEPYVDAPAVVLAVLSVCH